MANLFTPKQAQEHLGVSATGLRIYTTTYPRHLSTEATGRRRKFTEDDICFLSFVKERTDAGDNHGDVLRLLETDEGKAQLEAYKAQWVPLEPPELEDEAESSTALVPVAQLHAARLLLEDAQRREQEATERARILQEAITQAQRDLGKLEGELAANKAAQVEIAVLRAELEAMRQKPRPWWVRLFGSAG